MAISMRESSPTVEQWVQTTSDLIGAAASYAEGGQYDPDTDGMIRRIRVMASALQAALQNIGIMTPIAAAPTVTMADPPGKPQAQRAVTGVPPAPAEPPVKS